MTDDDSVQYKEVSCFAMNENCMYSFIDPLGLNVMDMEEGKGFITVCRNYDEHFIGVGKTREEAAYDWKAKFHCFFQKFMTLGPSTMKEEKLFLLMRKNMKMDEYDRDLTSNRIVLGTIEECRFFEEFPSSFRLESSDELCEVPSYEYVDRSFMLLRKGDRFRGVFEYQDRDNKLIRILHAMPIPKKPMPKKN